MDMDYMSSRRQMVMLYLSLFALLCAFICIVFSIMPKDPIQEIILSKRDIRLSAGDDAKIEITIYPTHARYSEDDVVCTTSDASIVRVISITARKDPARTIKSFQALLMAKSAGEAIITVSTRDGTVQSTCRVTVK